MRYDRAERLISKGRGKASLRVGQEFVVTRLTPTGFVVVNPRQHCLVRRIARSRVEQHLMPSVFFEMCFDIRHGYALGDLFYETGRYAEGTDSTIVTDSDIPISAVGSVAQGYAPAILLCQARPITTYFGVRMERFVQIRRGRSSQANSDGGYQQQGENAEDVLTLPPGHGHYEFVDVRIGPIPALIPMQIEVLRAHATPPFSLPMDWAANRLVFAAPRWGDMDLIENDTIIGPDARRYRVHAIYDCPIGMELQQGILEKLES